MSNPREWQHLAGSYLAGARRQPATRPTGLGRCSVNVLKSEGRVIMAAESDTVTSVENVYGSNHGADHIIGDGSNSIAVVMPRGMNLLSSLQTADARAAGVTPNQ